MMVIRQTPIWSRSVTVMVLLLALTWFGKQALAQDRGSRGTTDGGIIELKSADGRVIRLLANADDDEDGIENALEIDGFTYSPEQGLQPWDSDSSKTYYRTDPLRWSSDGDPYSDFMEVSGVNMPAGVPAPENHPLVAARPVINIGMTDYDVILISEITNTEGGEESSSFTNETSSSDEVGGEVSVGAELNPFKLVSAEVTASYSHTWTRTQSSTSTFGTNWSNTRSTNPSQAARLKLRVFMQNLGSATALDVTPTFNLVLGEKTIATITPNQTADRLAPMGLPRSRYPENGVIVIEKDDQNNDIIVSLEELKAIQMGAPLALVVTQVRADVARWNPDTQSFDSREEWSSFEGEIDPVVVTLKANLGDDDIRHYQVYVGTDFYSLDFTFKDVLSQVFELEDSEGVTLIENRRYPDNWYVSTPSQAIIDEWNGRGQPENLLDLPMFRNTQMVLMSPGGAPEAMVDLAIFDPDFKRVYVSAFPGNFPILSVRARVTINGEQRDIGLQADASSFYTNSIPFDEPAEPEGQVFVENARGDVTVMNLARPALYKDAAEVKAFSSFLPSPGAEYLLFLEGDPDKPAKFYCLFFDPQTGDSLAAPREYLTLAADTEAPTNFSDYSHDGVTTRYHFDKIRLDPHSLLVDTRDTTFVEVEGLAGGVREIPQFRLEKGLFGKTHYNPAFNAVFAGVDLRGTPFYLPALTPLTEGPQDEINVGLTRKTVNIKLNAPPLVADGYTGLEGETIQLSYGELESEVTENTLPGHAAIINDAGDDGFVHVGASNTLRVSEQLTMEAWIYPTGPGTHSAAGGIIVNKEGEYELARFSDGTIRWALGQESPAWQWVNSHYIAPESQWTHVAVVYNNETERVETYINGVLFHVHLRSGLIEDTHDDADELQIGSRQRGEPQRFRGFIDEVRIWNIARTQEQIRTTLGDTLGPQIYNSAESGLIGYWRFDQLEDLGIGADGNDDVRDYSVNGNHGDLVGDARLSDFTTDVEDSQIRTLPQTMVLHQNYPNPFNPETQIQFDLPRAAHVRLDIFNLLGQNVATLLDGAQSGGSHTIRWNGRDDNGRGLASGVYVYRLQAGEFVQTRTMLMMK